MASFDKAFDTLVNWQTLLFCLGIYVITYVLRTVTEALWKRFRGGKKLTDSNLWNELFLPLGPIFVGWVLAFLGKKFPWPVAIAGTATGKLLYGGLCGIASGWIYARLRAWLKITAAKKGVGDDAAADAGADADGAKLP